MSEKRVSSSSRGPRKLAAIAVAITLLAAACSNGSAIGSSTEAVSVGDASLSRSDLESMLVDLPQVQANGNVDAAATAEFLSNWIFLSALGQEIAAAGFEVTQANVDEATSQIGDESGGDISSPLLQTEIQQRAVQLAAEPYIAEKTAGSEPTVPEYLCSSHILLDTVEEADVVVQRLSDGEDFAALAAEVSTGPSGPNGGDLGCVDTSSFVPEFVEGARTVAPSGVTGPVQSQFGFHVIQVRSMGPLTVENHPEMDQAQIDSILTQAAAQAESGDRDQAIRSIIADVNDRMNASVTVDPRYGEWSSDFGVLPPDGIAPPG